MSWHLWLIVFFLVLFCFLFFIPIYFLFNFSYKNQIGIIEFRITLCSINIYRYMLISNLSEKKSTFSLKIFQEKYNQYFLFKKNHRPVTHLLRHINLQRIQWQTIIGLPDAFYTAIATGFLWGIKSFIFTVIYHFTSPASRRLTEAVITPNFNASIFSTSFKCIFYLRFGYIFSAILIFAITNINLKLHSKFFFLLYFPLFYLTSTCRSVNL